MNIARVLKLAFAASAVVYGVVAVLILGAPVWSRPVVPETAVARALYLVFGPLTAAVWAAGFSCALRAEPPRAPERASSGAPWERIRLLMACAFLESGAIFGLVLAFVSKDPRPALAAALATAVLILLLPTGGGAPRSD